MLLINRAYANAHVAIPCGYWIGPFYPPDLYTSKRYIEQIGLY